MSTQTITGPTDVVNPDGSVTRTIITTIVFESGEYAALQASLQQQAAQLTSIISPMNAIISQSNAAISAIPIANPSVSKVSQ